MAYLTFPIEGSAGTTFLEWQVESIAQHPDRIASGLGVTLVSGLTVRLAAGLANVGGCVFQNTANADFTTTGIVGTGSRIDRLVLRLTVGASGSAVDIQPVIKTGAVAVSGTPTTPSLTQTVGVGVYEIGVASWRVTAGTISLLFPEYYGIQAGASGQFVRLGEQTVGTGVTASVCTAPSIVIARSGLLLIDAIVSMRSSDPVIDGGAAVWLLFNGVRVTAQQSNMLAINNARIAVTLAAAVEVPAGTYSTNNITAQVSGGSAPAIFENPVYSWRQLVT